MGNFSSTNNKPIKYRLYKRVTTFDDLYKNINGYTVETFDKNYVRNSFLEISYINFSDN